MNSRTNFLVFISLFFLVFIFYSPGEASACTGSIQSFNANPNPAPPSTTTLTWQVNPVNNLCKTYITPNPSTGAPGWSLVGDFSVGTTVAPWNWQPAYSPSFPYYPLTFTIKSSGISSGITPEEARSVTIGLSQASITVNQTPVTGGSWAPLWSGTGIGGPNANPRTVYPAGGGDYWNLDISSIVPPANYTVSSVTGSQGNPSQLYMISGGSGSFTITYTPTTPPPPMTGTLSPAGASSCLIAFGQGTCNLNLNWGVTNPQTAPTAITASGMTNINVSNSTTPSSQSGTQSVPVPYGSRAFYLYNNAQPLAGPVNMTAACEPGLSWAPPQCLSGDPAPLTADAGFDTNISAPTSISGPFNPSVQGGTSPISVSWSFVSGPNVATISNATTMSPTFSNLSNTGTYTFQLTATDNLGNSDSDTMNIIVGGAPSGPSVTLWGRQAGTGSYVAPSINVPTGSSIDLQWTSSGASTCSAGGNPSYGNWQGSITPVASGTRLNIGPVNSVSDFVLQCLNSSGGSTTRTFTVTPTASQSAPVLSVSSTCGTGYNVLSWSAVSGAIQYEAERGASAGGPFTNFGSPSNSPIWSYYPGAETGFYYRVRAWGGGSNYSPYSNVVYEARPAACAADLTASAPTPSTATIGVSQTFSSTISNIGNISTGGSFNYFFQIGTDANGGGTLTDISPGSASAVAAGGTYNAISSYTFSAGQCTAGTCSVRACADKANRNTTTSTDAVTESDENNNCSAWTDVAVPSGNAAPIPTNVTISPSTIIADGSSTYTITATGTDTNGGSDIGSQYVIINLQGPNAGTYRGYVGWSNQSFPVIGTTSGNIACTGGGTGAEIDAGTYGGSYINLISCATSVSGNTRTSTFVVSFNSTFTTPTSNNTLSEYIIDAALAQNGWTAFGTFSLGAAAAPNLTASNVTPTTATAGVSTSFSSTITNIGNATTGAGTFTNLFQFDNDTDHTSVTATQTATAGPLAASATANPSASYTFPTSGTWYVRACADNNASFVGTVSESNEGDNCSGAWATVTVSNGGGASSNCTVATQITDNSGGTWTLGSNDETLRNGVHMAGGLGYQYKWADGGVYVEGTDNRWYLWNGIDWGPYGPTQPPCGVAMSGSLSGPNCTISTGNSSCTTTLSWGITSPEATPTAITATGMADINVSNSLSSPQSGTQSVTVPGPSRTFYLYNNAKSLVPTSPSGSGIVITASCSGTDAWNGSSCIAAALPPPFIDLFTANPTSINFGEFSTLTWSSSNTTSCTNNFGGGTGTSGSVQVSPLVTTTYTLTCFGNSQQTAPSNAIVTVGTAPARKPIYIEPQ